MQALLQLAISRSAFPSLKKLHSKNETYPVFGTSVPLNIDRSACFLFGSVTAGAHMTVCTQPAKDPMKIWVPRGAYNKSKHPRMLDNSVAGGIASGENPSEAIVREAVEEASLSEALVRKNLVACGALTYFHRRPESEGGDLEPRIRCVYDLKVAASFKLKQSDGEVEAFNLWDVETVETVMMTGQVKMDAALVLINLFMRHGVITAESESDFVEIVERLHRRLPFPTKAGRMISQII